MIHQRAARRRAGHPRRPRNFTGGPVFVLSARPDRAPIAADLDSSPSPPAVLLAIAFGCAPGRLRARARCGAGRGRRRLQAGLDGARRGLARNRAAGRSACATSARRCAACERARTCATPSPTTRRASRRRRPARSRSSRTIAGTPDGGRLGADPVELRRPVRGRRAAGLGERDRRRPPGRQGSDVAVLDTGVAYGNRRRTGSPRTSSARSSSRATTSSTATPIRSTATATERTSPGTIAEATNNGIGLTGLAYGVRLMPVRVLDKAGEGNAGDIARGHPLRGAARRAGDQPQPRVRHRGHRLRHPAAARRDRVRQAARRARDRRRVRQRGRRQGRLPGARRATCCRSARRPRTAACRSSRTSAAVSTSSPPAAARTARSAVTRTASPDAGRAATSSRSRCSATASQSSGCPTATRERRWRCRTSRRPPR